MFPDLDGKRAVISGAAVGIGAAVARRLYDEGARVALLDVDEPAVLAAAAELGDRALGLRCDIRSSAEVATAVARIADAFADVDILVNNAGVLGPVLPIASYPEEDFERVLDVNVAGTFRLTKAVLPYMEAAGQRGKIVNIASIAGKEGTPNMTAYAASKAAVIGFTKALGMERAGSGPLVNCVAPGGVGGTKISTQDPRRVTRTEPVEHPIGRIAVPEEVASLVAWLCSDEMSFSTGAVFDISGGRASY